MADVLEFMSSRRRTLDRKREHATTYVICNSKRAWPDHALVMLYRVRDVACWEASRINAVSPVRSQVQYITSPLHYGCMQATVSNMADNSFHGLYLFTMRQIHASSYGRQFITVDHIKTQSADIKLNFIP